MSTSCIVITGAAGALGQAVARRFHAAGATLALVDREAARLAQLYGAQTLTQLLVADVTSSDSVNTAIAQVLQDHGRVDALVHVAGGFEMGEGVHEISRASWDRMMELNAWSFVNVAQAVVPVMRARRSGRIVAVSAAAAGQGQALKGAYCAAKSALQRLVESLAQELRGEGISVNSVAPTLLDTPANRAAMPQADRSDWVSLESAAEAIAFLATAPGAAVQGQHLQLGTG